MNIFPLMWSLGLAVLFAYRANRLATRRHSSASTTTRDVLTDPTVWDRLQTTALLVGPDGGGTQMMVGFLLALAVRRSSFRCRRVLLILVLTPMMLSFVAVGAFFRYYYEPTLRSALSSGPAVYRRALHPPRARPEGALAGIVFADAWMWSPFVMLLGARRAGQACRSILYEAAEIDRASWLAAVLDHHLSLYPRACCMLALLFRTIEALQAVRHRVPADRGRTRHLDRDHRRSMLYRQAIQQFRQDQRLDGAPLHSAVHRDRADQPLSLFRQSGRARGRPSLDPMARSTLAVRRKRPRRAASAERQRLGPRTIVSPA